MHGTAIPNQAELPILRALWDLGTATSAQIAAHLDAHGWGYSNTLGFVCLYARRMTERGLICRERRPAGQGRPGYLYSTPHRKEALTALLMGE